MLRQFVHPENGSPGTGSPDSGRRRAIKGRKPNRVAVQPQRVAVADQPGPKPVRTPVAHSAAAVSAAPMAGLRSAHRCPTVSAAAECTGNWCPPARKPCGGVAAGLHLHGGRGTDHSALGPDTTGNQAIQRHAIDRTARPRSGTADRGSFGAGLSPGPVREGRERTSAPPGWQGPRCS